jgi:hypothetical protein
MNEATLKNQLVKKLRELMPGFVILRHEDRHTAGIPDISVTGCGRTSWWEVKHANPDWKSRGIQELTCMRLAAAGICFYITYEDKTGVKRTIISTPREAAATGGLEGEWTRGFDHRFVATFIMKVHGL